MDWLAPARVDFSGIDLSRKFQTRFYYMASSVSGQDESNPALWLATRSGKMELSCPLGTTRLVQQENFPESHVINLLDCSNPSLFGQDGLSLASFFYGPRLCLGP